MKKELNVKTLGQVWTPDDIVKKMVEMIKNNGVVLEPSCGEGAFLKYIPNSVAIELDKTVAPSNALIMDFFDYQTTNKFNTIIGNPPYVGFKEITEKTKNKLDMTNFDKRTNLYLFFIEKCIKHLNKHGELIFIVPRDFMKNTSAIKLNNWMYEHGTITDWIELGDEIVFDGACPNTVIFRYELDNLTHLCNKTQTYQVVDGQIYFHDTTDNNFIKFKDLFFVKVGAVSGADKYFTNDKGNVEFVNSTTNTTGKLRKMFYNHNAPELLQYKEILLKRKIGKFDEHNWYMWGRKYFVSDTPRIYVNSKTRNKNPFFYNACKAYDGSVLAIFPKKKTNVKTLKEYCVKLNKIDWNKLGFKIGGRFVFSQKALENSIFPW